MRKRTYQRRYDLDWLRVLAFTLLILFHTGMMFNTWDWHVKNPETSVTFEYVMRFLNQWRMPLLFFISGAAVWFAMEKYSTGQFALERIKRLAVPLIFGMFVVIPPQVYYERLFQRRVQGSFFDFYPTILDFRPYPEGNFSWHHLWYIPYILVFSFLMLPAFRYLKSAGGRRRLALAMNRLAQGHRVWFVFLLIAASEICLRPFWPANNNNLLDDWAQFTTTILIFALGFCFASSDSIWPRLEQLRFRTLALGIFATSLLYLFWYGDLEMPLAGRAFYRLTRSANIWFWILTALGFASRHLRFNSRVLEYSNQAVYPFYILHQTITVLIGYYLVDWAVGIPLKFTVLAAGTFIGSWLLYEFPIRRSNLMRPLFGLKVRRAISSEPAAAIGRLAGLSCSPE